MFVRWTTPLAVAALLACTESARALVIAADDASQSPYNDGWQNGDNGGSGYQGWTSVTPGGTNSGTFVANNNGNSQINSPNSSGKAWGLYGNSGITAQAIRPFAPTSTLQTGWTFSLDMDNGFIDSGGTVGFGLQNSSSQNLAEFFFVNGTPSYKVNRSGGSVETGVGFTNQGLHLTFQLTSANSFAMSIDQLSDGLGTNVTTVTGDLISQTGGQSVSQLRLFNANAGFNGDHDAFFNNIVISAVPEAPAVAFGLVACCLVGLIYVIYGLRNVPSRQPAGSIQDAHFSFADITPGCYTNDR